MATHNDTPVMRQYLAVKDQYPDAIVFFQLGDFYEMFYDDAVVAAQALDLTLTSRDKSKEDPVPMCGIPHHASKPYLRKLLDKGFRVAICDQVEDPKQARGIVRREVTQVITPGVLLETDHLDAKAHNYLVAVTADPKSDRIGIAALDLSLFELRVTEVSGSSAAADELARLTPKEILYAKSDEKRILPLRSTVMNVWQRDDQGRFFNSDEFDKQHPLAHSVFTKLDQQGWPLARRASIATLRYAQMTQPGVDLPACRLICYRPEDHLQIDETSLHNLELFTSIMERGRSGSLLSIIDFTTTAMGGRLLRQCLAMPLRDVTAIRRRYDAVELLLAYPDVTSSLREHLTHAYDLERLTTRAVMRLITPRELSRLAHTLTLLPEVGSMLRRIGSRTEQGESHDVSLPELLRWPDDALQSIADEVLSALVENPPIASGDGGIFRRGVRADLDELLTLCEDGEAMLAAIEQRERERTGISSLKVRYNKVFGYFIEITKANLAHVPSEYHRKQTLVNAERFVTTELAEYESKVLTAQERRRALEYDLFVELRDKVAEYANRLVTAAQRLARLDVLLSFTEAARRYDYVRPEIDDSRTIVLKDSRHPVVERCLNAGEFVPNDVTMMGEGDRLQIITGPNMAGKSTVIRQVALSTILAQMGSFVPCRAARIGVVDRIFTRIGASDNLARGESTFMVEMRETANILNHATAQSLIILDEIGRGTSTYDGISIAWAIAEYLHDVVQARTMFATHYHELTRFSETAAHVKNLSVAAKEWKGSIVFIRKLVEGSANRSYGIEVARLAGIRESVIERAKALLAQLEREGESPRNVTRDETEGTDDTLRSDPTRDSETRSFSDEEIALLALKLDHLTPLEALNTLSNIVSRLKLRSH